MFPLIRFISNIPNWTSFCDIKDVATAVDSFIDRCFPPTWHAFYDSALSIFNLLHCLFNPAIGALRRRTSGSVRPAHLYSNQITSGQWMLLDTTLPFRISWPIFSWNKPAYAYIFLYLGIRFNTFMGSQSLMRHVKAFTVLSWDERVS